MRCTCKVCDTDRHGSCRQKCGCNGRTRRLTLAEVKERVQACIDDTDTEGAHAHEDALHFEFFRALAEGKVRQARAMAREFLRAEDMERWYA